MAVAIGRQVGGKLIESLTAIIGSLLAPSETLNCRSSLGGNSLGCFGTLSQFKVVAN